MLERMKEGQALTPLPVRFQDHTKAVTYLYVRVHKSDADSLQGFTLFVCGLPVLKHALEAALEVLFSAFGDVQIVLHPSKLSAMAVFKDENSIEKIFEVCQQHQVVEVPLVENAEPHGVKRWLLDHKAKFPGNQILKKQLDEWMEAFEEEEEAARKAASISNDDGWTVVTRRPGRRKTADTETGIAVGGVSKAVAERKLAKKPAKQLMDFYTHQRREKQRSDLMTLQKRFEEDKRKVAEMKAARRYKPY